jgi:copper chaperone CopZ
MKTTLDVKGMKCGGCEATVQSTAQACAGVISAQANHRANTLEIEWDDTRGDLAAIRQAIISKGFQVS